MVGSLLKSCNQTLSILEPAPEKPETLVILLKIKEFSVWDSLSKFFCLFPSSSSLSNQNPLRLVEPIIVQLEVSLIFSPFFWFIRE